MTPLGALAVAFGLWLGFGYGFSGGWMYAKIALTAALVAFHLACGRMVRIFAEDRNTRDHVYYRWFNEVPTLIMFASVFLVVLKPF
jgi:putative membrane protein